MLGRFRLGRRVFTGAVEDGEVRALAGMLAGRRFALEELELLPPCNPSKIVGVGLNYIAHAEELGMPLPEEPVIFLKPPSALLAHRKPIILWRQAGRVEYEGELAVVMGRRCRDVSPARALDYVLGYTCFNDVTARELQAGDGQWTRSKGFDTFAPLGPFIATEDEVGDVQSLRLRTYLNSELRQNTSTSDMLFSVAELVSFISGIMTLLRGDVIATGTPPGVGEIKAGDVVSVEISEVGRLVNPVSDSERKEINMMRKSK
ncbi:MAG: fumarylacetoacetate hydrolase family protein [Euryarchaeota archaeon]|nr:fumarylacetoacetate hydrolase family protein [Euryarchaeota archaeon]